MKRIITLILLLGAGGAVFFTGWAQFDIPAGSYGIIRSKTHGIDSEVVKEGKLRWVWYKVIPRNVTITVFTINESSIPIDFSGVLPSGETYSAMAGLKTDFSYSFSGSLSFKVKADSLPALSDRENLFFQADLDQYYSRVAKELDNHTKALLWTYGENEQALKEFREKGTISAIEKSIKTVFPDIEITNWSVKTLRFPDFILYNEVRQLYRDFLAAQRTDLRETIAYLAAENVVNRRRFEELAAYGELLTKYPILLQYLAIEKGFPPKPGE